jgi:hypothetical protein
VLVLHKRLVALLGEPEPVLSEVDRFVQDSLERIHYITLPRGPEHLFRRNIYICRIKRICQEWHPLRSVTSQGQAAGLAQPRRAREGARAPTPCKSSNNSTWPVNTDKRILRATASNSATSELVKE